MTNTGGPLKRGPSFKNLMTIFVLRLKTLLIRPARHLKRQETKPGKHCESPLTKQVKDWRRLGRKVEDYNLKVRLTSGLTRRQWRMEHSGIASLGRNRCKSGFVSRQPMQRKNRFIFRRLFRPDPSIVSSVPHAPPQKRMQISVERTRGSEEWEFSPRPLQKTAAGNWSHS